MKVFVGLGNPGPQYSNNLHNLGFLSLEYFADHKNMIFKDKKSYSYAELNFNNNKLFLLKPTLFMNLSGEPVQYFLSFYKNDIEDLWIVMDDVSLPFGSIRIRESGSDGGHKGLRDIILKLGTDRIKRIRLGCGPIPPKIDLDRYVLMNIPREKKQVVKEMMENVSSIIEQVVEGRSVKDLMNEFNRIKSESV